MRRLIPHDSDRFAAEPGEADHDIGRVGRLDFQVLAVIDDLPDERAHVIGLARAIGQDLRDLQAQHL